VTGASANDRENWLLARRAGIGGSDVAAIIGADDYRDALAVYADKVATGAPTEEEAEVAYWGREFEPLILRRFAAVSGRRVVRDGKLLRSRAAAHHMVTLDGVQLTSRNRPAWAKSAGVAEVKTTGYGSDYSDDLPPRVQVQIQWQLFVTGASWATCIWLPFPERRLQWIDVEPHPAFQAYLVEQVDAFWGRVQRREPPAPTASESSRQAIKRLYPRDSGEVVRLIKAAGIMDEYQRNAAALELLKQRQALIKNTLAATIREAKYAVLDDGRYWRTAQYQSRDNRCKHCGEVLSHTDEYRTYTFAAEPRKKPLFPTETRELVAAIDHDDDATEKQLAESLVGAAAPSNDAMEDAAP